MFRENADADAATNAKGVTLNDEFSDNCIHEPLSRNGCVGDILYRSQDDKKFVSAYSGYGVLFTRPFLQAFCDLLQNKVANRVAERVVDVFEPVEIEEQKRNFVLSPTSTGECLALIVPEEESDWVVP